MTRLGEKTRTRPKSFSLKEILKMPPRLFSLLGLLALILLCVAPSASAAPSGQAWWHVTTGSRPTHLWEPQNSVQEIVAPSTPFSLTVDGKFAGAFNFPPFFPAGTAANVQTALEGAYGAGDVEVTGGPAGSAPLIVTAIGDDANDFVAPIQGGGATVKVLQIGGSGRIVITATNIGNAPVDGTESPVTVVDELPAGVEATKAQAFAGAQGSGLTADCAVAGQLVSCAFEEVLPAYNAIEVEIYVTLTGKPPVAVAPGTVTVSGGSAPPESEEQHLEITPEVTPFGIEAYSSEVEQLGGEAALEAGSHPFQFRTSLQFNAGFVHYPVNGLSSGDVRRQSVVEQPAQPRNIRFSLPAGLVGDATQVPTCEMPLFNESLENECPAESAIGVASVTAVERAFIGLANFVVPVFNLPPAPGEPARFGFSVAGAPVLIDTKVDPDNEYRIIASVSNTSQVVEVLSSTVVIWGTPGDPSHDSSRGFDCVDQPSQGTPCERPQSLGEGAFLRQPVSCATSMGIHAEIEPWNVPLGTVVDQADSTGASMSACNQVPFTPAVEVAPTRREAAGRSGFDFELSMPNVGWKNAGEIAEGQAKKVEVTLPDGVTINPSQANGLAACSSADYARETANSLPGQGCPDASKIGSVKVSTPLLEEEANGAVYVAEPFNNPFDSLVALYVVAKIPERGILIKQAGEVTLDPTTGRIGTVFDDLPQVPFDSLKLHLFDGGRAPLVMPPRCGSYEVMAKFTPWHASNLEAPPPSEIVERVSSFTVDRGLNGSPCPTQPPHFKPEFIAGTINNSAGSYSPLSIRLTREDGEQELSRFSVRLPEGVVGKLAGIPLCSDAAIAAADARTGPGGGQEELDNPSCPAASQLGRTLVGAGVGPELSYAPGKVYLAGPYQGAKLSIVGVTTVKVGPFDLGNVVIRQALRIDPETAVVTSDGRSSDPIPHIIKGIVVHARDIRIDIDREKFVLNPTGCERMSAVATVLATEGGSADPTSPFQAADCASLGFRPKLSLRLLGGTKRGDEPRLRAVLKARKGDANIGRAQVTLPHSAFLEQAHIRTICTRVQFNAGGGNGEKCPKASIYGKAKATSPLLDETLRGPVYLRSSNHELPDLVAALGSRKVDINLVGRIDSLDGRIRTTFATVPDAPVTQFVLEMQGGQKGLIVNSTDICHGSHRAKADFKGQNGRQRLFKLAVKAQCDGKKGGEGKRR
jgi:hypothetical protein